MSDAEQGPPGAGPDEQVADEASPEEAARAGSLGDPRVDAAVADLRDLDQAPVDAHAERYERAHEALHAALDDDGSPAGPTASPYPS